MTTGLLNLFVKPDALRSFAAMAFCCILGLAFGRRAIAWLQARFREPIKSISPTVARLHQHKAQTPTMGGLFIVGGILIGSLVFGNLRDQRVWIAMLTLLAFAIVGAVDDLVKLRTQRRGISAIGKLTCQGTAAVCIGILLAIVNDDPGRWGILETVLALVVGANAVNLTDGLDGLASGCGLISSIAITGMLLITSSDNLAVVSAALAGTLAAFLWFNRHPARVFMGDTGSQAIGALLGYLTISSCHGGLFILVGGVFLVETASVALQLLSYQVRGKRLFLCAPLHHHFQFAGWAETSIMRLFCAASLLFAIAAVALTPLTLAAPLANPSAPLSANLTVAPRVQPLELRGSRSSGLSSPGSIAREESDSR